MNGRLLTEFLAVSPPGIRDILRRSRHSHHHVLPLAEERILEDCFVARACTSRYISFVVGAPRVVRASLHKRNEQLGRCTSCISVSNGGSGGNLVALTWSLEWEGMKLDWPSEIRTFKN
jgi:hypothetical protein